MANGFFIGMICEFAHEFAANQKWEVLERLVASEAEEGRLTNYRPTLALAAVKADLLHFGLKNHE